MKRLYPVLILTICGIFITTSIIYGSEITESVKTTVDKVLEVLKDDSLKRDEKASERREILRNIIKSRFDFEEMARRTLARNWRKRTKEERKEFVSLFSRFLEASYLDKIENYSNEEVVYEGESVSKDRGVVKTKIITKDGTDIPISYRLLKKNDRWMIYDVIVEGVSLVSNYRTQFNRIIKGSSFDALLKQLRKRVDG